MRGVSPGLFSAATLLAASVIAQPAARAAPASPAPTAAAPGAPPAAAAGHPPSGYPSPGYGAYPGYPPYGYRAPPRRNPPRELAYHEGMTIPNGYHLEGSVRKGLAISGALVLGIPWVLGLSAASIGNYANASGWLVLPGVGPWLTLALRNHCTSNDVDCMWEPVARTFLVLDGLMQTTGAALLIWGIADEKQRVVRDDVVRVIGVVPTRVGSGYGLDVLGTF